MAFKGFFEDSPKRSFSNKYPKRKPRKPQIKIHRKYIELAEQKFGIYQSDNDEYWPRGFIRQFPLALQITDENFSQFLDWLCNRSDYKDWPSFQSVEGSSLGLTIDWWKKYRTWFLNEENRHINPTYLAFTLRSRKGKEWLAKFARRYHITPETKFVIEAGHADKGN